MLKLPKKAKQIPQSYNYYVTMQQKYLHPRLVSNPALSAEMGSTVTKPTSLTFWTDSILTEDPAAANLSKAVAWPCKVANLTASA